MKWPCKKTGIDHHKTRPRIEGLEARCLLTSVPAIADLGIGVNAPTFIRFGDMITYDIALSDHGQTPPYGVTVTDALPRGTTFVSGSINGIAFSMSGGVAVCSLGDGPIDG